jgi:uncharacterized protein DUF6966
VGPKTQELVRVLDDLERLLTENDQDHWARWMARCVGWLRERDFRGITHVLGAYGGMGSFSDLLLDDAESNARLGQLRKAAHALATEIKREAAFDS